VYLLKTARIAHARAKDRLKNINVMPADPAALYPRTKKVAAQLTAKPMTAFAKASAASII